jgi:exopolysaccharide biosynthesis operon protein EpsL
MPADLIKEHCLRVGLSIPGEGDMDLMRLVVFCALIALQQQGLAQELEGYTPLERERWIQDEKPLKLKLFGGLSYDSNLFRLSDDANSQAIIGSQDKSDIIYQLGAGGKYELVQSRQKFLAEATVTEYKYQNFDNLDNTSNSLLGEWQWQLGNDWNGDLGVGHRRYLESFANFQANVRDMVEQERVFGKANYLFHSHLKFTLDADWYDTEHGDQGRSTLNYKINNTAFTVNWVTPALNTVGLRYRTSDARYPNSAFVGTTLIDNSYTEDEYSVVANWKLGGASEAIARIGYTRREFEQAPSRNLSEPTWRVIYRWIPTGKSDVEFATWRELAEFQDLTANYARTTGVSVVPTWSITPKVVLRGKISLQTWNYVNAPGIPTSSNGREDKDRLYQVSALWTPLKLTELTLSVESGKRTSNVKFADYDYEATSILLTRYF